MFYTHVPTQYLSESSPSLITFSLNLSHQLWNIQLSSVNLPNSICTYRAHGNNVPLRTQSSSPGFNHVKHCRETAQYSERDQRRRGILGMCFPKKSVQASFTLTLSSKNERQQRRLVVFMLPGLLQFCLFEASWFNHRNKN